MDIVSDLSHASQKRFKKNIEFRDYRNIGGKKEPFYEVTLYIPNGDTYKGRGKSKKLARYAAAKIATERDVNLLFYSEADLMLYSFLEAVLKYEEQEGVSLSDSREKASAFISSFLNQF
jgi:hypothetical protein